MEIGEEKQIQAFQGLKGVRHITGVHSSESRVLCDHVREDRGQLASKYDCPALLPKDSDICAGEPSSLKTEFLPWTHVL